MKFVDLSGLRVPGASTGDGGTEPVVHGGNSRRLVANSRARPSRGSICRRDKPARLSAAGAGGGAVGAVAANGRGAALRVAAARDMAPLTGDDRRRPGEPAAHPGYPASAGRHGRRNSGTDLSRARRSVDAEWPRRARGRQRRATAGELPSRWSSIPTIPPAALSPADELRAARSRAGRPARAAHRR